MQELKLTRKGLVGMNLSLGAAAAGETMWMWIPTNRLEPSQVAANVLSPIKLTPVLCKTITASECPSILPRCMVWLVARTGPLLVGLASTCGTVLGLLISHVCFCTITAGFF